MFSVLDFLDFSKCTELHTHFITCITLCVVQVMIPSILKTFTVVLVETPSLSGSDADRKLLTAAHSKPEVLISAGTQEVKSLIIIPSIFLYTVV